MRKPTLMHRREGAQDLPCDFPRLAFGERLLVDEIMSEVAVFAVFHGDIKPPRTFVPAVGLDEELSVLAVGLLANFDVSLQLPESREFSLCPAKTRL